jgi:pimeloyl-ACP methyl ester carboxylesterase
MAVGVRRFMRGRVITGLVAFGVAVAPMIMVGLSGSGLAAAEAAPLKAAGSDHTSALEAGRVDSVPTPKFHWYHCDDYPGLLCSTVQLPRDYDEPDGPSVELAVVKHPAGDQAHKTGTIFVNPGGPGGSATELAAEAQYLFGSGILRRFDIVGVDPRGTNYSQQVKCFADARRQQPVVRAMNTPFPYTATQEKQFEQGAAALGRACSGQGAAMAGAMSTAEDARDLDVLRRAVGDKKLTYLGFSYGTYLGQVYANMFPDRVRSMVLDGVVDPIAWAGTNATRNTPQTVRMPSGAAGTRALKELLRRCGRAGQKRCEFAAKHTVHKFDRLARRLKREPVVLHSPFGKYKIDYAMMISDVLSGLYDPEGYQYIVPELALLWKESDPARAAKSASAGRVARTTTAAAQVGRRDDTASIRKLRRIRAALSAEQNPYAFSYDNSLEAFTAVLCTDSVNPSSVTAWPKAADRADAAAKYFGRLWAWSSAPCAAKTWTVQDEDAYRGPFTKRTAGPVLVVGNRWDPATNYRSAERVARLLPNSRLLLSDSWGHTAYGSSACATRAVSDTLRSVRLPARGTHCVGHVQPYAPKKPKGASKHTVVAGLASAIPQHKITEQVIKGPGRL